MELHNEIEQLAFELYENSGRKEGKDLENWFEAEQIILARHRQEEENLPQNIESGVNEKVEQVSEVEKEEVGVK
jgi:hypothetical protein